MATPSEHRSKALHNEELLNAYKLAEGRFAGWAVTILFYSALHWMRALAAQEGFQIKSYSGNNSEKLALQQIPLFRQSPQPFNWYRSLKDESQDARYEMTPYSSADFRDLKQRFFDPFKAFIISNLRI
ncbi:MAG: hypothetical protein ACLQVL_21430 [Terriglobia bacterium]